MTKAKQTKKRGRGRPPIDNPANARLNLRITPDQHAAYHAAAAAAGVTLTTWLYALADRAAGFKAAK